MLQCVLSAYQRIAKSMSKTTPGRRVVPLGFLSLEERATPASPESFLPLIHPPEAVLVSVFVPPASAVAVAAVPANVSVRSDLFGVGDAGKTEPLPELDEMMSGEQDSAHEDVGAETTPADALGQDADAVATVIIEDMTYVPQVA